MTPPRVRQKKEEGKEEGATGLLIDEKGDRKVGFTSRPHSAVRRCVENTMATALMSSSASLSLLARPNVGGGVAARTPVHTHSMMACGKQCNNVGLGDPRHAAVGGRRRVRSRAFTPTGTVNASELSPSLFYLPLALYLSLSRARVACSGVISRVLTRHGRNAIFNHCRELRAVDA